MKPSPRPPRWWDLPASFILLAAMITAASRLVATRWTDHLSVVQTVVFFGAIAGLALGQSRFSSQVAGFFAASYGAYLIPWQLGMLLGRGIDWPDRIGILLSRVEIIVGQLIRRQPVQDSLVFIILMAVLFWVLSVHAGYTLSRRGSAWSAVLPSGVAIFTIHAFDAMIARHAWYLAVYIFFALVLVARYSYLHHQKDWQHSHTALPPHLGLDFIRFTLLVVSVIVIFSWSIPALARSLPIAEQAYQQIRRPWDNFKNEFNNVFVSLRASVGLISDYYGSNLTLGRGNKLSEKQVFAVRVPPDAPPGLRYYWRARIYDTYNNGQWQNKFPRSRPFDPTKADFPISDQRGRFIGMFDFVTVSSVVTVFSPPQPLWINRYINVDSIENPDGTVDVSALQANPPLRSGEAYQVKAALTDATVAQLQTAGEAYPEWVVQRYLQLPDTITDRTRRLAERLATGKVTPLEKALVVTSHLRSNITYSEFVPPQPPRQETVDWFLFDGRMGFCNYYASAEVVLLRLMGVPARMAVGYAQGERLNDNYIVRQRDAHAWPEVYFPGIGWVEFEPTVSQPEIDRPLGNLDSPFGPPGEIGDDTQAELEREQQRLERELQREDRARGGGGQATPTPASRIAAILYRIALIVAFIIAIIALWQILRRINFDFLPIYLELTFKRIGLRPPAWLRQLAYQASLPPLTRSYLEINHALKRLGSAPASTDTPAERASSLTSIAPEAGPSASRLVHEYQLATFSPQPANLEAARQAGSEVRSISYTVRLKRLLARFQKPVPKTSSLLRGK